MNTKYAIMLYYNLLDKLLGVVDVLSMDHEVEVDTYVSFHYVRHPDLPSYPVAQSGYQATKKDPRTLNLDPYEHVVFRNLALTDEDQLILKLAFGHYDGNAFRLEPEFGHPVSYPDTYIETEVDNVTKNRIADSLEKMQFYLDNPPKLYKELGWTI